MPSRHDYERIFKEDGPTLWRTVYAYAAGRRQVADDAVAEAFARAIRHDGQIRRPVPWLYTTALRVAASELRHERRPVAESEEAVETSSVGLEIDEALHRLSPSQRAAVYLHYQVGLPVRECASRMGTSVGAVKVHLFRGRARLRHLLGQEDDD